MNTLTSCFRLLGDRDTASPLCFRGAPWMAVLMGLAGGWSLTGQTLTASQTVALSLSPSGVLYSVPLSVSLAQASSFSAYVGSVAVTSEIRTTPSGSGNLVLQATSDFSPANGPSIASGNLTYQCLLANYGTACSGQVQASTTAQTAVVSYLSGSCTGGGGSCSSLDPNTVTIQFSVADRSTFVTGYYTANLTFTISAT